MLAENYRNAQRSDKQSYDRTMNHGRESLEDWCFRSSEKLCDEDSMRMYGAEADPVFWRFLPLSHVCRDRQLHRASAEASTPQGVR